MDFFGFELASPPTVSQSTVEIYYPYAGYQAESFSLWLNTPNFQRIAIIAEFVRLEYKRALGGIGLLKLELPAAFDISLFQEDSILEIWRGTPGYQYLDGETVWFIRDWDFALNDQNQEIVTVTGYDANYLLDSRIIAYSEGTAFSDKSGAADDVIKAYIREQLTTATVTARRVSTLFRVETDTSSGPTVQEAASWAGLLPTLQNISTNAAKEGQQIFFDVVCPEHGILELRTYLERGQNRGMESGNRLVLSPIFSTLGNVRRSYVSSGEKNYIYVGGDGDGAARKIEEVQDSERVGISPFNRRELFLNKGNVKSRETLRNEGQALLRQRRPRETFTGRIENTPDVQYYRDWGLGYIVAAEYKGAIRDARVDGVKTVVTQGEVEIEAELRVEA